MSGDTLNWLFLAVSAAALITQLAGLKRVLSVPRPGLVRTVACRVAAAAIYVALGVATLLNRHSFHVLGLLVFSATQTLWLANTVADVRLRREM